MKKDIQTRKDIEQMVNSFYSVVKDDEVIGFLFRDVIEMNWEKHIPIFCDFWDNIIFYSGKYKGNPMNLHTHLHHIRPLDEKHFLRWLKLFKQNIDKSFKGEKTTLAKKTAENIVQIMIEKIISHKKASYQ